MELWWYRASDAEIHRVILSVDNMLRIFFSIFAIARHRSNRKHCKLIELTIRENSSRCRHLRGPRQRDCNLVKVLDEWSHCSSIDAEWAIIAFD